MKIKSYLAAATVVAGLVASSFASAALYTFDGSSVVGASVKFIGFGGIAGPIGSISFPDGAGGFDFTINASSAPTVVGLKGNLGPSSLTVLGPISTFGPIQFAGVTGSTAVSIFDGVNTLTADATFDNIVTVGGGTGVSLSLGAGFNLSNVLYSGTNAGLQAIASTIDPTLNLSASFTPGRSLTTLMTKGESNKTSYAISFAGQPVPEPSTMALLTVGLGMVGFSLARARRR